MLSGRILGSNGARLSRMRCNGCGANSWYATPSGVDVSRSPALSGLVLCCQECGRCIRLLHRTTRRGVPPSKQKMVERAKRRLEARGVVF